MLKRLFEKYNISLEQIVLKEYKRLSLDKDEAWLLIALFNYTKDNKTFQKRQLASMLDYEPDKLDLILTSLLKKNYYELELVKKSNKTFEKLNLNKAFKKIQDLITNDVNEEKIAQAKDIMQASILNLEKIFKRPITNIEYNRLKELLTKDNVNMQVIKDALTKLEELSNPNFNCFEKIILSKPIIAEQINVSDEKKAEVLKLFESIKK